MKQHFRYLPVVPQQFRIQTHQRGVFLYLFACCFAASMWNMAKASATFENKKSEVKLCFFLISDTLVTAINSQFCSVYLHLFTVLFTIMINFGYRISVAIQSIDPF